MNLWDDINSDKFITLCVCITIVIVVISMATCKSTSYPYMAEITKAETEEDTEALRHIRELIDSGVNPIAARCAIYGDGGSTERRVTCAAAIGNVGDQK